VPTGDEGDDEEDEEEEPEPLPFFVAYEVVRNVDANNSLRSDIYGAWFVHGGGRVSAETRLDNTSLAGDSPGQRIVTAGTAADVHVLWIDRGGDNAGTNPAGSDGEPAAGSYGDLASVMISAPSIVTDVEDESFGELVEVVVPDPTFLNDEATTTAQHIVATVSRTNQVFAAWSERDDQAQTIGPDTLRKDISLRVADVSGGSAAGGFLVDDAPLDSLIYATALAVREDGTIAVSWVENFGGLLRDGFLRRFSAPGTPLENPIEIAWDRELNLAFLPDGRLSIAARTGGDIARLRTEAPEEEDEEAASEG
ncbi:MAG: hypothetical protein KDB07_07770, partial [Planctomycetes bacterium]|nr:hypothetical protein [Planctomycetota bacterium]